MSVRDMVKSVVEVAALRTGATQLVRKLNRDGVRILMYHRFPDERRKDLDRQWKFLAANYQVLSLAEVALRLQNNDPLQNVAVITVDDGYSDMHRVAFPILREHGLPATLFVTSGFIDRACWIPGDRVRYHFAQTQETSVKVTDERGEVHSFETGDSDAPGELRALLKRVPQSTRSRILSELEGGDAPDESVASRVEYQPCTWSQLRGMAEGGVSIGAHTVTHPILSRVQSKAEMEREILESKACIEREIQMEVDLFAYPNGMPEDIDRRSEDCVRRHFQAAVTASFGLNPPGSDLFQLRRLGCDPGMPIPEFARMLAGPLFRNSQRVSVHGRSADDLSAAEGDL